MKKLIVTYLLIFSCSFAFAQEKQKILFVGNSFTFYWNLPSVIEKMAEEKGLDWDVSQSTESGATLEDHWEGNKNLKTRSLIGEKFDVIIFQEHSTYPLKAIEKTTKYFNLLKQITHKEASIYFYSTWVYPKIETPNREANTQNPIEQKLEIAQLVKPQNLLLVGKAFDLFNQRYPEHNLLSDDLKHPSPNGTYLAACVIFSTLSNKSSKGLSRRYLGKDENGKKIFYVIVEKNVAKKAQEIADSITQESSKLN